MSSEVVSMSPEHTMRDAAVLMNQHNMHRLPNLISRTGEKRLGSWV